MNNKSPLRYPGGKTRACKCLDKLINQHFDMDNFKTVLSPFFGGGSFEFFLQNKYDINIISNDKCKPLYTFWNICKNDKDKLCKLLYIELNNVTKEKFLTFRNKIIDEENDVKQAYMYFIINRCSFSGATLSGGFSLDASKNRFTTSSIDRIKKLDLSKYEIYNYDFKHFLKKYKNDNVLIFLDPPYYLEKKSKLYGNNGDMHINFNHKLLYKVISKRKNWIMTYNNCEYIKDLYKDFKIIETSWSYGMNTSKKSSEIVIIG